MMKANQRTLGRKSRVLTVVAVGLIAHLAFVALHRFVPQSPDPDYVYFYEPIARSIVAGKGFTMPDGAVDLRYPPGTSLWAAFIFQSSRNLGLSETTAIQIERALITVLVIVLVYFVSERALGHRYAFVATLVVATYPFQLVLTDSFDNTHLFALGLLGASYLLLVDSQQEEPKLWRFFAMGMFCGLASLFRPIGFLLGLVFLVVLLFTPLRDNWRQYALCAVLLAAGNIVTVLPWEIWAHRMSGHWVPIATNGPPSMRDGLTFGLLLGRPISNQVPENVRLIAQEIASQRGRLNSVASTAAVLLEEAERRPGAVAELIAVKSVRSWYATNSGQHDILTALVQIPYLVFSVAGIIIAWKQRICPRSVIAFTLLLILYFWVMTIMALSILRYMIPPMLILLMFAAITILELSGLALKVIQNVFAGRPFIPAI